MEDLQQPLIEKQSKKSYWRNLFVAEEGSIRASVQTLTGNSIGAGIFSLPWALSQSGLLFGVAVLICGIFLNMLFYRFLLRAMEFSQQFSYIGVVRHYIGQISVLVTQICILMCVIGTNSAFQVMSVDFSMTFLTTLGVKKSNFLYYFLNICVFAIICFLSLPKKINSLRYISIGSTISSIYVIIVVIIQSHSRISQVQDIQSKISYANISWNSLYSLSLMVYAYSSILALPVVYSQMKDRNYKRGTKFLDISIWVVAVLYISLAVLGYFSYIEDVPQLIVNDNSQQDVNWPILVAKMIIGLTLISNMTINLHPLRTMINEFLDHMFNRNGGNFQFYVVNYSFVFLIFTIATLFPNVIFFFNFLGGFALVVISFVMPCLCYVRMEKSVLKVMLVVLLTSILAFMGFASAILSIINLV